MIHHQVVQCSAEWHALRLGRPTASQFHRIVTPTGALSKQSRGYMCKLIAERILGYALDGVTTAAMQAGREREPEAAAWYEFATGRDTEVCGVCLTDDGKIGASPDRFVGTDGLLEIKCPNPDTHVGYLLGSGIQLEYKPQLQGQMLVTGRAWIDSISFCAGFPARCDRVLIDLEYCDKLAEALTQFCDQLEEAMESLAKIGCVPAEPKQPQQDTDWLGVSEADVEAILDSQRKVSEKLA